jgi:hypothetical protein
LQRHIVAVRSGFTDPFVVGCHSRTLLLAILLATACRAGPPPWCEAIPGATTIVMDDDARWRDVPRLIEIWEARWDDERGRRGPRAVAVAEGSGMVAVADHVFTNITFISPSGIVLRHWPRQARGSGPLLHPTALDWRPDGTLAVLDRLGRKILRLDTAGHLVDESLLAPALVAHFPDWRVSLRGSDVIGTTSPRIVRADTTQMVTMYLLRTTDSGKVLDTVLTKSVPVVPGRGFSPTFVPGSSALVAAHLGDDLLAVAGDVAEFRVRILGPDGQVIRQICRITPPTALSQEETADARELGKGERAPSRARIGRLFSDNESRIWAQRDRASGVFVQDRWFGPLGATFDVLDVTGEYLGEVRAPDDTRLAAAHGNTVIGLRADRAGQVTVVGFRLEARER